MLSHAPARQGDRVSRRGLDRGELELPTRPDRLGHGKAPVGRGAVGEPGQRLVPDDRSIADAHDRLIHRRELIRRDDALHLGPRPRLEAASRQLGDEERRRDGPEFGQAREPARHAGGADGGGRAGEEQPERDVVDPERHVRGAGQAEVEPRPVIRVVVVSVAPLVDPGTGGALAQVAGGVGRQRSPGGDRRPGRGEVPERRHRPVVGELQHGGDVQVRDAAELAAHRLCRLGRGAATGQAAQRRGDRGALRDGQLELGLDPTLTGDIEHHPAHAHLAVEVAMDRGLVADPDDPTVAGNQAVDVAERAGRRLALAQLGHGALPVIGMERPHPEVVVGEPLLGGVAEDLVDLRADVDARAADPIDVAMPGSWRMTLRSAPRCRAAPPRGGDAR